MSQHPSLLGSQKGKRHRSVFKRYEKLKYLVEKEKWDKTSSIYALPKVKSIKFKVKKEKAATAETPAAAAAPAAGVGPQAQAQAAVKPAAEKQAPPKEKKTKA